MLLRWVLSSQEDPLIEAARETVVEFRQVQKSKMYSRQGLGRKIPVPTRAQSVTYQPPMGQSTA